MEAEPEGPHQEEGAEEIDAAEEGAEQEGLVRTCGAAPGSGGSGAATAAVRLGPGAGAADGDQAVRAVPRGEGPLPVTASFIF